MRDTYWIYMNLFIAWFSILIGFYLLSILVNYTRQFNGSIFINVFEVLMAVVMFLLWLTLWRLITIRLFKRIIGKLSTYMEPVTYE
ncbi:MAG: hypothetical protein QXM89_00670 [Candidatus Bathyarchaeia archaeon]